MCEHPAQRRTSATAVRSRRLRVIPNDLRRAAYAGSDSPRRESSKPKKFPRSAERARSHHSAISTGQKHKAKGRKRKAGAKRRAKPVRIDARLKGVTLALEPPIDRDPSHLSPAFRAKLDLALADLLARGTPFKFNEGFRTRERQQWLW